MDIKTAYLQGTEMMREVYVRPPEEAKSYKVYGLKDVAKHCYLNLMEVLKETGREKNVVDKTIIIWGGEGSLEGIMCMQLNDLCF